MSAERLQKLLARAGLASRRGAEEFIRQGRVTVNGVAAGWATRRTRSETRSRSTARCCVCRPGHRYLLLNKPRGYLVTRSDPEGRPTVYDLLPPRTMRGLFPVGRLDFHSEGLLLLTDDGDLAQRVAHPSHGCIKLYRVRVRGRPDRAALDRLRGGIVIDGKRTAPARIRLLRGPASEANAWLEVELGEGRSRQIREMFFRIGHPVKRLKRVAIGSLSDPRLAPGGVREVTQGEVARLRAGGGGRGGAPGGTADELAGAAGPRWWRSTGPRASARRPSPGGWRSGSVCRTWRPARCTGRSASRPSIAGSTRTTRRGWSGSPPSSS